MGNELFIAKVPVELLELYRVLVQNASSTEVAVGHLVSFLEDAKSAINAIQPILDAAKARNQNG